jgi:hypothetical protein
MSARPNFAGEGYDFDGTETRVVIINCALQDCRANHPLANPVEVSEYVDAYLTRWEKIREAMEKASRRAWPVSDPTVQPALTPEEWKAPNVIRGSTRAGLSKGQREQQELIIDNPSRPGSVSFHSDPQERHALAALALYGQTFGFTREDVEMLREEADDVVKEAFEAGERVAASRNPRALSILALADRISALLPPETP